MRCLTCIELGHAVLQDNWLCMLNKKEKVFCVHTIVADEKLM